MGTRTLLEFQHDDFWIRAQTQWRTPSACAARGENLHLADAAESVHELTVNTSCHPTPGNELTEMRVTRKLQRESQPFGCDRIVGRVHEKNAGTVFVNRDEL